ncbi:hypothetical protein BOTNAR_0539g00060 [Botryotinia narcissicola]|uniref:Uncharacterized protein n=1 Tax=Botryotinia narcissicola TaxID=278944 RepID=A0A4Z1HDY9_9HELO|nr:hypothetical protein BOTNAR_0539g00060 [Botryotinia narcissicola]
MSTSTKIQPSSSPQLTKTAHQPSYSASPEPRKSTYRILRDAGFRSMNDFMFSHGLKLHNDEDFKMAKEMIERMKEEDLRRLEFRAAKNEEDVKDEQGTESSGEEDDIVELIGGLEVVSDEEEERGVMESIGFADVVSSNEVTDGVQVSGVEIVEELDRVSSQEESDESVDVDVDVDGGMVDEGNVGEDFGYEDLSGGDDCYEDFEDDFDEDFFYDA